MVSKLIALLLVAAATSSVWGLMCYKCNSAREGGCEFFNGRKLKPELCTDDADICYYLALKDATGSLIVRRYCHESKRSDICTDPPDNLLAVATIYKCWTCNEDACNSSNSLESTTVVLALGYVIQWVISKII